MKRGALHRGDLSFNLERNRARYAQVHFMAGRNNNYERPTSTHTSSVATRHDDVRPLATPLICTNTYSMHHPARPPLINNRPLPQRLQDGIPLPAPVAEPLPVQPLDPSPTTPEALRTLERSRNTANRPPSASPAARHGVAALQRSPTHFHTDVPSAPLAGGRRPAARPTA